MKNNTTIAFLTVLAAFAIHLLFNQIQIIHISFVKIVSMHALLGVLIIVLVLLLNMVQKQLPEKLGLAFLAGITFKVLISAMYIYLSTKNDLNNKVIVIHFFVAYLYYLVAEVIFALQILNKPNS